jgi:serine/threonine protein kinase
LADAIASYVRKEDIPELGALKRFKIPPITGNALLPTPGSDEYEAVQRMNSEIGALRENIPGLPRLLDANESDRWVVTEYFPEKSLEHQPTRYRGNVLAALKAFRSLVESVKAIHKLGMVHRDIKPANVFIRNADELVLGDFGIVYLPGVPDRVTVTGERVGPRDYMPPWTNLGRRHAVVKPNIDIFMLGKLLWSMVDGRILLPYTYHQHPQYDFNLTQTFPGDPNMNWINRILDKCVVEHEMDCTITADELLSMVDAMVRTIERGGQLLANGVPRPCRVCGVGFYTPDLTFSNSPAVRQAEFIGVRMWPSGTGTPAMLNVHPFICDNCGHVELFTRAAPGASQTC